LNRGVPTHDLVVADATLSNRPGRWQIGVDEGRIAAVEHCSRSGREEIDVAGAHLDTVHTLDRIGHATSSTPSTTFHLQQREHA